MLVKQVNGLQNPMEGPPAARAAFQESTRMMARLQSAGQVTWASSLTSADSPVLVIHGYAPDNMDTVRELLQLWGLPESLAARGRDVVLPLKLGVGSTTKPELNVQTRSVFDLIELAAAGVEVPAEHIELGLADPGVPPPAGFLRIQSSPERPSSHVLVEVRHRGCWFYVPANDGPSKLAFRLLQTLINMNLVEAMPQAMPTLTIPVGK